MFVVVKLDGCLFIDSWSAFSHSLNICLLLLISPTLFDLQIFAFNVVLQFFLNLLSALLLVCLCILKPILGRHTVTFVFHLPCLLLAGCPAHCPNSLTTLADIFSTFVLFSINVYLSRSRIPIIALSNFICVISNFSMLVVVRF